jgi:hypothetical protein
MIALYIIAAITSLFFVVAMLPISLSIRYNTEFSITLLVFGIKIFENPKKKKTVKISDYSLKAVKKRQKKALKKRRPKKESGQVKKESAPAKKKSLFEVLSLIKELLSALLPKVWGGLKIKTSKIIVKVGSDDAAKTAMLFPAVNAAVMGLITFLDGQSKLSGLNRADISVSTDFLSEKITADIDVTISMRVWQTVRALFATALKYATHKISK